MFVELGCRYSMNKTSSYGKAVHQHLTIIKTRLEAGNRQGWLRFLKEICDFKVTHGHKKTEKK